LGLPGGGGERYATPAGPTSEHATLAAGTTKDPIKVEGLCNQIT